MTAEVMDVEDEDEDGPGPLVKCQSCDEEAPEGMMDDGRCPDCQHELRNFKPVDLIVEDVVIIERKVTITSPFCPDCRTDLTVSGGLTLRQYEYSEQSTSLGGDDWGSSEGNEGYIALAYACSNCGRVIAEGTETHNHLPVPN